MKITRRCNETPEEVFRGYVYCGVIFGVLTPLFVLNTTYSHKEYNTAKWKGVGVGILCHIAAFFLWRFVIASAVVGICRLLIPSASQVYSGTVFLLLEYAVACGIVILVLRYFFKKTG